MPPTIECSGCHKQYRWKPELAGKRVKCKCGAFHQNVGPLAVGWLGTISLIMAPIFIVNNTVRYVGCLGMKSSFDN